MKWETRALSEVCDIPGQYGLSVAAHSSPAGVPMLRMGNIDEGRLSWKKLKFVHLSKADLDTYRLEVGDLLFNRTNSAELVGKTAVFDGAREAVFASYIVRFRLKRDVADPAFICHFINSDAGRAYIEANMARAVGQVNISASTMQRMQVPLPPLPEQKRIAARLREQLAEVEKAREALQSQLEAAEKLQAAALREGFECEEIMSSPRTPFERIAILQRGHDLPAARRTAGEYPVVTSAGIVGTHNSFIAKAPGVVTGRSGSVGKVHYIEQDYWPHNTALYVKDFRDSHPRFVYYLVKWIGVRDVSSGTGVPTLDRKEVHKIEVPHPTGEEQVRIAAKLDTLQAPIENLIATITTRLTAVEKLPAALLREVFNPASIEGL